MLLNRTDLFATALWNPYYIYHSFREMTFIIYCLTDPWNAKLLQFTNRSDTIQMTTAWQGQGFGLNNTGDL